MSKTSNNRAGNITDQLTPNQLNDLREAFDLFDKDGNGDISVNELHSLFRCFGARKTPEEIAEILVKFDEDQSGLIEFDEFVAMMAETILEPDVDPELTEAYKVFDRNEGGISPQELKEVLAKFGYHMSNEEVQDMVDECDWDGDGQLNFEEFCLIMMGKTEFDLD